MATAADGTYPTGMHSCRTYLCKNNFSQRWFVSESKITIIRGSFSQRSTTRLPIEVWATSEQVWTGPMGKGEGRLSGRGVPKWASLNRSAVVTWGPRCGQTDTTENITFPKTICAGCNNYLRGISFTKVKDTKRTLMRILSARGSRKLPNAEIWLGYLRAMYPSTWSEQVEGAPLRSVHT